MMPAQIKNTLGLSCFSGFTWYIRGEQPSGVSLLRNMRAAMVLLHYLGTNVLLRKKAKKGERERSYPKRSSQWPPLNAASPGIIFQLISIFHL